MLKTKASTVPHRFILVHYDMVVSLTLLLDKSGLSNDVKKQCNTAFKVIGIIYANLAYNTGTHLLSRKEFDTFFKSFPAAYFNNRAVIPVDMIVENIKKSIRTSHLGEKKRS